MICATHHANAQRSGAAPALTATIAGQPELSVVTLPPAVPLVKAGG